MCTSRYLAELRGPERRLAFLGHESAGTEVSSSVVSLFTRAMSPSAWTRRVSRYRRDFAFIVSF